MKKQKYIIALVLFICGLVIFSNQDVQAAKIKLNYKKKTIYTDESLELNLSKVSDKKAKWYSSNKSIATVGKKGRVKSKKTGKVTITAVYKKKKYKCVITIKPVLISQLCVTLPTISIKKGNTYFNTPEIYPENAYNKKIKYTSSNESVATISSSGEIKAKNYGTCTITGTAQDGSRKQTKYKVRVGKNVEKDSARYIAHRGLSMKAPENTVKAFELAGQAGFHGIETDVWFTKDDKIICNHDKTFRRMCGKKLRPENLTLSEIKNLKIINGNNYNKYKNDIKATKGPTLEQYLDVCKKYNAVPYIEVKGAYDGRKVDLLYKKIKAKMGKRPFEITGFDLDTLKRLGAYFEKNNITNAGLHHAVEYYENQYDPEYKKYNISVFMDYLHVTKAVRDELREKEIPLEVWVVDDPFFLEKIILDDNLKGVITNVVPW